MTVKVTARKSSTRFFGQEVYLQFEGYGFWVTIPQNPLPQARIVKPGLYTGQLYRVSPIRPGGSMPIFHLPSY